MNNYSISITLGAGDKGREWDRIIRAQAKRKRMSIGAYIRTCVYENIQKENPTMATEKTEPEKAA